MANRITVLDAKFLVAFALVFVSANAFSKNFLVANPHDLNVLLMGFVIWLLPKQRFLLTDVLISALLAAIAIFYINYSILAFSQTRDIFHYSRFFAYGAVLYPLSLCKNRLNDISKRGLYILILMLVVDLLLRFFVFQKTYPIKGLFYKLEELEFFLLVIVYPLILKSKIKVPVISLLLLELWLDFEYHSTLRSLLFICLVEFWSTFGVSHKRLNASFLLVLSASFIALGYLFLNPNIVSEFSTLQIRFIAWQDLLDRFTNILFGHGLGVDMGVNREVFFENSKSLYIGMPHNTILSFLFIFGIFGWLSVVFVLWFTLTNRETSPVYKRFAHHSLERTSYVFGLLAFLISSTTTPIGDGFFFYFWLFVGCINATSKL